LNWGKKAEKSKGKPGILLARQVGALLKEGEEDKPRRKGKKCLSERYLFKHRSGERPPSLPPPGQRGAWYLGLFWGLWVSCFWGRPLCGVLLWARRGGKRKRRHNSPSVPWEKRKEKACLWTSPSHAAFKAHSKKTTIRREKSGNSLRKKAR